MFKHYLIYILTITLVMINQPAFSCSMDMTSASALVIQAILKSILDNEMKLSDREITKIKKAQVKKQAYWTYVIQTSIKGGPCQAIGYSADIDAGCKIKVKRLNHSFVCK